MIGVDPFTWFIAICLFLGYSLTEVPYAIQGKTSPRKKIRMEKLRQRRAQEATAAGGEASGGTDTAAAGSADPGPGRRAVSAWWADWCEDATEWRRTRRQTRKARRDVQPLAAQPRSVSGLTKKLTKQDDANGTQIPAGRNAALHRKFLGILARMGVLDAWKRNMANLTADQRRQYWARIATLSPDELADQLNNELAEYLRVADQRAKERHEQHRRDTGDPFPAGPVLRPLSTANPTLSTTNPRTGGFMSSEVVTLPQAIAWGTQQSEQAQAAVSDAEVVAASLSAQEVSGEPIALCAQIQETAAQLASLYVTFAETMQSHTSVAEAYAATPDAGNKEFNQLG